MQVSVENTGALERRLRIQLGPEPLEEELGRRLRETARTVRLNGFRPGKAPVKEVRRRFGKSIRAEVAAELMQSSFHDALESEQLRPAGMPQFEPPDLEAPEGLAFTATFEVLPDIELADLAQVKVRRPEAEVTPADLDAMVERLREGRKTWSAVDRPARNGDRVSADLAQCDGEFQHEGVTFVAGGEFFFPNVAEAAVEMTAGATKRVTSTFPEVMVDEALRGREAEFDLTVREVSEGHLPDLDDAFFASFDVAEGGEEAFREAVKKDMDGRLSAAIRTQVADQVFERVADLHVFDVPNCLVRERVAQIHAELPQLFGAAGESRDPPEAMLEVARREAEKTIRQDLLIRAIVEARA